LWRSRPRHAGPRPLACNSNADSPASRAAGTLATLGDQGLAVQEALTRERGLAQPEIAWHIERDRIAVVGCFLGLLTGTLAKFATDLKLMMQTKER
jgi:3-carboxy-cis,cis-muconate cycloisomerase